MRRERNSSLDFLAAAAAELLAAVELRHIDRRTFPLSVELTVIRTFGIPGSASRMKRPPGNRAASSFKGE